MIIHTDASLDYDGKFSTHALVIYDKYYNHINNVTEISNCTTSGEAEIYSIELAVKLAKNDAIITSDYTVLMDDERFSDEIKSLMIDKNIIINSISRDGNLYADYLCAKERLLHLSKYNKYSLFNYKLKKLNNLSEKELMMSDIAFSKGDFYKNNEDGSINSNMVDKLYKGRYFHCVKYKHIMRKSEFSRIINEEFKNSILSNLELKSERELLVNIVLIKYHEKSHLIRKNLWKNFKTTLPKKLVS